MNNAHEFVASAPMAAPQLDKPLRITEHHWPEGTVPVVSICAITYNHESFITECIESLLMQETTFPVEVIIHDDASTDGTANVIREYHRKYPHLIRTILRTENQRSKGHKMIALVYSEIRGGYCAFCEGDDYWTNPRKLEIQLEVLKANQEAVLVSHGVQIIESNGSPKARMQRAPDGGQIVYGEMDVLEAAYDHLNTWLARTPALSNEFQSMLMGLPMADDPVCLYLLQNGRKGISMGQIFSAYRAHPGGIWSTRSEFQKRMQMFVFVVSQQAFYKPKYRDEYAGYVRAQRGVIASAMLRQLFKLQLRDLAQQWAYIRRFDSDCFRCNDERGRLLWAMLIAALRATKVRVCRVFSIAFCRSACKNGGASHVS